MIGITRKIGKTYTYDGSWRSLNGVKVTVIGWIDQHHGISERGYRVEIIENYRNEEWVGEILDNVSAKSLTSV